MPSLEHLDKAFGEKQLFKDFSYTFSDTGLYLITGNSGSGKTTLLRMMAGLDKDYNGRILGMGGSAVSYSFQEPRLFPSLSALGNVAEPLRAMGMTRGEAEAAAADHLMAIDFSKTDFNRRPSALSGGMRQRVSLARALAVPRPILLLDEPEQGLDGGLRQKLSVLLRKAAEKRLVLIATHVPGPYLPFAAASLVL